nr:immunoglobulin heavy chain junction region [Macaca mulatta]
CARDAAGTGFDFW